MHSFRVLIFALGLGVVGVEAQAGLYVEPYGGYASSTNSADMAAQAQLLGLSGTVKFNTSGPVFGARAGWQFGSLFLAADYGVIKGGGKVSQQPVGPATVLDDESITMTAIGAAIGARIESVHIFAVYDIQFDSVAKVSNAPDITWKGTGVKVGLGYDFLSHLALNLEYWLGTYTKSIAAGVTSSFGESSFTKNPKTTAIVVTLSAPFNFGGSK